MRPTHHPHIAPAQLVGAGCHRDRPRRPRVQQPSTCRRRPSRWWSGLPPSRSICSRRWDGRQPLDRADGAAGMVQDVSLDLARRARPDMPISGWRSVRTGPSRRRIDRSRSRSRSGCRRIPHHPGGDPARLSVAGAIGDRPANGGGRSTPRCRSTSFTEIGRLMEAQLRGKSFPRPRGGSAWRPCKASRSRLPAAGC